MSELSNFEAQLRQLILQYRENPTRTKAAHGDEWFRERALKLFALQFEHNTPYRQFCEGQGVSPGSVREWDKIPAIPTPAFKERDLTSLPLSERTTVFHSSGTTGHRPSCHFHSEQSIRLYEDSLLASFKVNVLKKCAERRRMIFLTPSAAAAPHSSLVHMFERVRGHFGTTDSLFAGRVGLDGGWELEAPKAGAALQRSVASGQAVCVLGTAFLFVHLLDYLSAHATRYALPPGSLVMETGGYKGRSRALPKTELHSLLRNQLGTREIICEYGMSELSSQAYAAENGFHFPPWVRIRIVSPETGNDVVRGQAGIIRVFDLANVYSVMAIETADIGIRHDNGFELIGRAEAAEVRGCSLMSV